MHNVYVIFGVVKHFITTIIALYYNINIIDVAVVKVMAIIKVQKVFST